MWDWKHTYLKYEKEFLTYILNIYFHCTLTQEKKKLLKQALSQTNCSVFTSSSSLALVRCNAFPSPMWLGIRLCNTSLIFIFRANVLIWPSKYPKCFSRICVKKHIISQKKCQWGFLLCEECMNWLVCSKYPQTAQRLGFTSKNSFLFRQLRAGEIFSKPEAMRYTYAILIKHMECILKEKPTGVLVE